MHGPHLEQAIFLYGFNYGWLLALVELRPVSSGIPVKSKKTNRNTVSRFFEAQLALADPKRVIAQDLSHSSEEERYYCFGMVGDGVLTVRFTYRERIILIFGAGYWRKGRQIYERENQIHKRATRERRDHS